MMFPEKEQLPDMSGNCRVSPVPPDEGLLSKKSARPEESMAPYPLTVPPRALLTVTCQLPTGLYSVPQTEELPQPIAMAARKTRNATESNPRAFNQRALYSTRLSPCAGLAKWLVHYCSNLEVGAKRLLRVAVYSNRVPPLRVVSHPCAKGCARMGHPQFFYAVHLELGDPPIMIIA